MNYKKKQREWIVENGIDIGSVVLVANSSESFTDGWNCRWVSEMDSMVGKCFVVSEIYDDGIVLIDVNKNTFEYDFDHYKHYREWSFPYFVLIPIWTENSVTSTEYRELFSKESVTDKTNSNDSNDSNEEKDAVYQMTGENLLPFLSLEDYVSEPLKNIGVWLLCKRIVIAIAELKDGKVFCSYSYVNEGEQVAHEEISQALSKLFAKVNSYLTLGAYNINLFEEL